MFHRKLVCVTRYIPDFRTVLNPTTISDPVFSDTCVIDNKFLSLNYLASYEDPQPSTGCILSGPIPDREVHIIELQAPNSSR